MVCIINSMKVFELHFNPRGNEDMVFDSFCYEPINIDEKKLGSLYMVGHLKNALPRNYKLLEELSVCIKKEYYKNTKRSAEKSLIEGLKKGNEFLDNLTKQGDVSWLGNLNFAVLTIKDFVFNFTKVENIATCLLRGGKITDIAKNLSNEEIEPYPLKVFGNIVSGKLFENDVILILTKEVSDIFLAENILNEIASLNVFNEKKLKEIFSKKEKNLREIFGVSLVISLVEKEETLKVKVPKLLEFERIKDKFSIIKALSPIKTAVKIFLNFFIKIFQKILYPFNFLSKKFSFPSFKITLPKFSFPKVRLPGTKYKLSKNFFLFLVFIVVLIIGFYLFQFQEKKEVAEIETIFLKAQGNVRSAEQFLILNKKGEARNLFFDSWKELASLEKALPQDKISSPLKENILSLKEKIESSLTQLSNLIILENPEIFFDFSETNLAPQKIVKIGRKLYLFNPLSQNLASIDIYTKLREEINTEKRFNLAQPFNSNSAIFFSKPNNLTVFTEPNYFSETNVDFPVGEFDLADFKKLYSNLYFLDRKNSLILKCPFNSDVKNQKCIFWLSKDTKKPTNVVSFAVDGSIWILDKDGGLEKYYSGDYQENLNIKVFPELTKPSKISTSPDFPYLYILEPEKNRILIFTKSGEIIKQFQSDKFDNLKDFSISEDGNTVWLLNGLIIYKISLTNQ